MEPLETKPTGRRLEGPGSEARLRRLQARFARLNRARPGLSNLGLGLLGVLTFLGFFVGGMYLLR